MEALPEILFKSRANGKLLLSGEYFVLDGALALACPTKLGQTFTVLSGGTPKQLTWISTNCDGNVWFEGTFDSNIQIISSTQVEVAEMLQKIFKVSQNLGGLIPSLDHGIIVETKLEFPREWGLGSSSTLIHCISKWLDIDQYLLLENTFGGSGYDLACADHNYSIFYRISEDGREVFPAQFNPPFADRLHFIYLGQKQSSREAIAYYQKIKNDISIAKRVSNLTLQFGQSMDQESFNEAIRHHENLIADSLKLKKVKDLHFADFEGEVKSLGAWGGDFILASSMKDPTYMKSYFLERNYFIHFPFAELVKEEKA